MDGHATPPTIPIFFMQFQLASRRESRRASECRGQSKSPIYDFHEASFLAEDKVSGLCHGEVFTRLRVFFQARPVDLIGGQAIERNQTPGNVVCAFVRQKVPDKVAAASRNDAAPIRSIFLECVPLEGIDLVADEAGDCHWCPLKRRSGPGIAEEQCKRRDRRPGDARCFAVACAGNTMPVAQHEHFVYDQTMNANDPAAAASRIAAAIGEPARAQMLYCLSDGRGRTSTELAVVAGVTPSTASVHLKRLRAHRLVTVFAQGKHRYYSLNGVDVAAALEALSVLTGSRGRFPQNTPHHLRAARTCYDHIAGSLGVSLHDRCKAAGWLSRHTGDHGYELTAEGTKAFEALGIDVESTRALRRRFAFACLDWSERRPHLAGALGAALLKVALKRKWLLQDLDSRALRITRLGQREMTARFGLKDLGC